MAVATTNEHLPARREGNLVSMMAAESNLDRATFINTIKATCFPGGKATNEQIAAFLVVANRYHLDPLVKEIYAFPTKSGGIQPLVGIDGWLKVANSNPQMDGLEAVDNSDEKGNALSATCTIWRKDRKMPVVVTEWLKECKRNTDPWNNQPRRMCRHRATIQAIRYAFGFAGFSDDNDFTEINGMPAGALPEESPVAGLIEEHEVSNAEPVIEEAVIAQDDSPNVIEGRKRGYSDESMAKVAVTRFKKPMPELTSIQADVVFEILAKNS